MPNDSKPLLEAATVTALAVATGIPLDDEAMAARIAVGAGTAIAAVRAQVRDSLFDYEPGDYLGTLERLAAAPGDRDEVVP